MGGPNGPPNWVQNKANRETKRGHHGARPPVCAKRFDIRSRSMLLLHSHLLTTGVVWMHVLGDSIQRQTFCFIWYLHRNVVTSFCPPARRKPWISSGGVARWIRAPASPRSRPRLAVPPGAGRVRQGPTNKETQGRRNRLT